MLLEKLGNELFAAPYNLADQLQDLIVFHLPKHIGDITQYQSNLRFVCHTLQDKLTSAFRKGSPCTFLLVFLDQLPLTFAQLKRKEILIHARNILINDYHNIMIASSGDASEDEISLNNAADAGSSGIDTSLCMQKLKFDTCQISINTCKLMKYFHEIMSLVCHHYADAHSQKFLSNSIYDITNILFHTARDVIELFIAIIPIKFTDIIYSIARMGAVFYNDCFYIIHNLILVTYKYRNQLIALRESKSSVGIAASASSSDGADNQSEIYNMVGFVDFIPRLRKLAEECLVGHLKSLKAKYHTIIVNIHVFPEHQPSATKLESIAKAAGLIYNNESEVHNLLTEFTQLTSQWSDVLTTRIHQKLVSILLEDIVQELMAPVLAADDITIIGANEIQRLFRVIIQKIK